MIANKWEVFSVFRPYTSGILTKSKDSKSSNDSKKDDDKKMHASDKGSKEDKKDSKKSK